MTNLSVTNFRFSSLILYIIFTAPALTLRCYKCISLECPHDLETCKNIENSVLAEAAKYFEPHKPPLSPCPPLTDPAEAGWKIFQSQSIDSTCKLPHFRASCSATRFQVDLAKSIINMTTGQLVSRKTRAKSFGTIFGCASSGKWRLLQGLGIGGVARGQFVGSCTMTTHPVNIDTINLDKNDHAQQLVVVTRPHVISLEHCHTPCLDCDTCFEDFCINREVSRPKPFSGRQGQYPSFVFVVAIIGAGVVIIIAYLIADTCATGQLMTSNQL